MNGRRNENNRATEPAVRYERPGQYRPHGILAVAGRVKSCTYIKTAERAVTVERRHLERDNMSDV